MNDQEKQKLVDEAARLIDEAFAPLLARLRSASRAAKDERRSNVALAKALRKK